MARRLVAALLLAFIDLQGVTATYYGVPIGIIGKSKHDFSGKVFAATESSIYITEMNYDGKGPAAHFWVMKTPGDLDKTGLQLPDEKGSKDVLKKYSNAVVYLNLPSKITDYKSIGIFCTQAGADFGHVEVPPKFVLPKEQSLGKLINKIGKAGADDVTLKDSGTMQLKQFEYDAGCQGSSFFMVGATKNAQAAQMTKLLYNGKTDKLDKIAKTDVTLSLPTGHDWTDFAWFSVYCVDSKQSRAEVDIDKTKANAVPVLVKAVVPGPGPNPVPADGPNSQKPADDKKKTGGKGNAGSLSVLSLLTLTVAAVMTALITRQCFDGGQHVKSS